MSLKEKFRSEFQIFYKNYLERLDELVYSPEYKTTGDVIDISKKRKSALLKKAKDLIEDFNNIHFSEMSNFLILVSKYNEIQSSEKKAIVREEIQKYKSQLRRLLNVLNIKAGSILEEMDEDNISFTNRSQLEKLFLLDIVDIVDMEEFWLNGESKSPIE
jgi:hypothetical protein